MVSTKENDTLECDARRDACRFLPSSIVSCVHTIFELHDDLLADKRLEEGVKELREKGHGEKKRVSS